jgi:hypothetical protein
MTITDILTKVVKDYDPDRKGLHVKDIVKIAKEKNLWKPSGATPQNTASSTISQSIKNCKISPFLRVSTSVYTYNDKYDEAKPEDKIENKKKKNKEEIKVENKVEIEEKKEERKKRKASSLEESESEKNTKKSKTEYSPLHSKVMTQIKRLGGTPVFTESRNYIHSKPIPKFIQFFIDTNWGSPCKFSSEKYNIQDLEFGREYLVEEWKDYPFLVENTDAIMYGENISSMIVSLQQDKKQDKRDFDVYILDSNTEVSGPYKLSTFLSTLVRVDVKGEKNNDKNEVEKLEEGKKENLNEKIEKNDEKNIEEMKEEKNIEEKKDNENIEEKKEENVEVKENKEEKKDNENIEEKKENVIEKDDKSNIEKVDGLEKNIEKN